MNTRLQCRMRLIHEVTTRIDRGTLAPRLLDLCFAIVFFNLPLEGAEPNAVKGFGVETM